MLDRADIGIGSFGDAEGRRRADARPGAGSPAAARPWRADGRPRGSPSAAAAGPPARRRPPPARRAPGRAGRAPPAAHRPRSSRGRDGTAVRGRTPTTTGDRRIGGRLLQQVGQIGLVERLAGDRHGHLRRVVAEAVRARSGSGRHRHAPGSPGRTDRPAPFRAATRAARSRAAPGPARCCRSACSVTA